LHKKGTFLSHSGAAKSIEMDQIRFLRFKSCVFRRRDGAHGDEPQSRQIAFQISSGFTRLLQFEKYKRFNFLISDELVELEKDEVELVKTTGKI